MKRFIYVAAALIAMICLSGQGQAADLKIVYLDSQRILTDSIAGKEAYGHLEKLKNERQKEIDKIQQTLKNLGEDISVKGPMMKEAAKMDLQTRYDNELKNYNRTIKDAQDELRRKELNLVKPISDEVNKIIEDYGKQNSIDMILDKRDPGMIYTSERLDITDVILKLYDSKHQPKAKGKK
jgi:outer membrane protein